MLLEVILLEAMMAAQDTRPATTAPEVVQVSARMTTDKVTADLTRSFEVQLDVADGWTIAEAGHERAFLQIDVPLSVTLAGKVLETHRDLARNGFMAAPYERQIDPGATRVEFTVTARPGVEDRLGLNIMAYVSRTGGGDPFFFRHRLELPLSAAAVAEDGDAANSAWGPDGQGTDGLRIGARADEVALPRADGSVVKLSDYAGEKNVILTTYRAFW